MVFLLLVSCFLLLLRPFGASSHVAFRHDASSTNVPPRPQPPPSPRVVSLLPRRHVLQTAGRPPLFSSPLSPLRSPGLPPLAFLQFPSLSRSAPSKALPYLQGPAAISHVSLSSSSLSAFPAVSPHCLRPSAPLSPRAPAFCASPSSRKGLQSVSEGVELRPDAPQERPSHARFALHAYASSQSASRAVPAFFSSPLRLRGVSASSAVRTDLRGSTGSIKAESGAPEPGPCRRSAGLPSLSDASTAGVPLHVRSSLSASTSASSTLQSAEGHDRKAADDEGAAGAERRHAVPRCCAGDDSPSDERSARAQVDVSLSQSGRVKLSDEGQPQATAAAAGKLVSQPQVGSPLLSSTSESACAASPRPASSARGSPRPAGAAPCESRPDSVGDAAGASAERRASLADPPSPSCLLSCACHRRASVSPRFIPLCAREAACSQRFSGSSSLLLASRHCSRCAASLSGSATSPLPSPLWARLRLALTPSLGFSPLWRHSGSSSALGAHAPGRASAPMSHNAVAAEPRCSALARVRGALRQALGRMASFVTRFNAGLRESFLAQAALVLAVYVLHFAYISPQTFVLPVELLPNRAGLFQHVQGDSLAGWAALGGLLLASRISSPGAPASQLWGASAGQDSDCTLSASRSRRESVAGATKGAATQSAASDGFRKAKTGKPLAGSLGGGVSAAVLLRHASAKLPWKGPFPPFLRNALLLLSLFGAYVVSGYVACGLDLLFYFLHAAGLVSLDLAMHRSLQVLFAHLAWVLMGTALFKLSYRNFFHSACAPLPTSCRRAPSAKTATVAEGGRQASEPPEGVGKTEGAQGRHPGGQLEVAASASGLPEAAASCRRGERVSARAALSRTDATSHTGEEHVAAAVAAQTQVDEAAFAARQTYPRPARGSESRAAAARGTATASSARSASFVPPPLIGHPFGGGGERMTDADAEARGLHSQGPEASAYKYFCSLWSTIKGRRKRNNAQETVASDVEFAAASQTTGASLSVPARWGCATPARDRDGHDAVGVNAHVAERSGEAPEARASSRWFTLRRRGKGGLWAWWAISGYLISCLLLNMTEFLNDFALSLLPSEPQGETIVQHIMNPTLNTRWSFLVGALAPCLSAPWWEELLYRGFCLPLFSQVMPLKAAAVLSSLLFAVHHMNVQTVLPLWVLGLTWTAVYLKSQNLLSTVMIHAMWNSRVFLGNLFGL
ncbi:CAAX amino terminal protease family protein [Besnoitia besnoiti]|uniref:CAAX amino terminal protease family protein n=1 Tax=Besnoitia besnoiti TaxID=94643 RepID=A0A2A9M7U2_BESBE|nr:CAAX amino terminal protease family protein [Besnoitia besnoiti]PFH31460.1 CAAX amino terminal protease family protein [Besnoitia besnoiti]